MIKYNSNNISDWYFADDNIVKVYRNNAIVFYKISGENPTPPSFDGKWLATYSGGTTSSAECDSSSAITNGEITKEGLVNVEIGDCVTSIGYGAFNGCSSLTSCTIGNGVTSIGYQAFYYCTSLTNCTIGDNITTIDEYAFNNCSNLTSINIPSGVTSISQFAFQYCSSLTSIDIPSGVTSIGSYTFTNCNSLTSITITAITPPAIGRYAFINTNNCPIYVPSESVETYKAASGWSDYASRIQAIP